MPKRKINYWSCKLAVHEDLDMKILSRLYAQSPVWSVENNAPQTLHTTQVG